METDSDSDGSHISATPPREPNPPPPPPPPPALLSSHKLRSRVTGSSRSSPISKSKSKSKPSSKIRKPPENPNFKPSRQDPPPNPLTLPHLPFQIRRPTDQNHEISAVDTPESLPAGYFSKFASFSKIRRTSLNLESIENYPSVPTLSSSLPENVSSRVNFVTPSWVSSNDKVEAVGPVNSVKFVKKHPNLIGGNVDQLPVKQRKCVSEGNFVRLNINGYGYKRKFMNKGWKKNQHSSNRRRYYVKSKRKSKPEGNEPENGFVDEDGLVSDTLQNQKAKEKGGLEFDCGLIEEAILACRDEASDENLVKLLKLMFGFDGFRDGQLEAIKMVLSGKSTMVVLPTGAGKSLCYQLPAMILPGMTLIVSPLVALMIDQLERLPPMIPGRLLSSSQTAEEVSETLRMLQEGVTKVLFISPERFSNPEFLSIFSSSTAVSLVVVDEAHCVSEWSHNFRPSYMRLRASLLRANLNVDCILAMTATATSRTLQSVMRALEIPQTNLIQTTPLRENLQLSISSSGNRMKDLLMLIKSSSCAEIQSIIIYCKFQFETDSISKYLCDNNISAKSYHSGIPAKDRRHTQELFCSNKIRVVVATVAFGMGLDKKDIGAVIHYSLPESLEEYVQEIGRAGRDGRLSYCHLFFDSITYFKLRSLIYSDGVDEYAVNKFLGQVFSSSTDSLGKICSIVKESASRKFDMKEEVMLTILTQLELGEVQFLRLLPQINVTCTLNFHKTSPALLANKDIVVATILKKSEARQGQYCFDIPTVANGIGLSAINILNQLQDLKMKGEITFEVKDPAYCYTIVNVPGDFCLLAAHLTKWLLEVESSKVRKLDAIFDAAIFAIEACEKVNGCCGAQHTPCLQRKISDYFSRDDFSEVPNKMSQSSPFLRADIKVFLQSNSQAKFTPRAIARIMHGIASPAYPSATWSRTHFWGRYTQIEFQVVMEAAKAELINFVGKNIT